MRWLLVGGAGFIGSNLTEALLLAGEQYEVCDLAHGCNGLCLDKRGVEGFDRVVNLAAVSGIPACDEDPLRSALVNVLLPCHLMSILPPEAYLLHFGSQAALKYEFDSYYGLQKFVGMNLTLDAAELQHREGYVAVICPSNIYGPYSEHKTSAVHKWIRSFCLNMPLEVHGSGEQLRDFVYVGDIVRTVLRWGFDPVPVAIPHEIPGCSGTLTPIVEVARMISDNLEFTIDPRPNEKDPMPAHEDHVLSDPTPLAEGIAKTVAWYQKRYSIFPGDGQ